MLLLHAAPAGAQAANPNQTPATLSAPSQSPATLTTPSTKALPPSVTTQDAMAAEIARFDAFDALQPQDKTINFPGTYDTLPANDGGWRSWLYDHGLYVRVVSVDSATDNLLSESGSRQPQEYSGHKMTLSETTFIETAVKLAGSGKDITQLVVSFEDDGTSWETLGPSTGNFLELHLYSFLFNRRVEVAGGLAGELSYFIGIFAGGDPILASGLSGSVPIEAGLSAGTADTPFVNLTLNGDDGWYSKTGVQRSTSPRGQVYEGQHNGVGVDFDQPGANPLYIEEVGVLRPAAADGRQIWLRAGGFYNTTNYAKFDGDGTSKNWMLYALGDYQIYKPSRLESYRGLFAGFSVLIAPVDVNAGTRTFEARLYQVGLVPGRPTDATTLTLDINNFTNIGRDTLVAEGLPAQRYQASASLLYAIHVTRGLYVSPTLTYLHHPAFIGDHGSALNLGVDLSSYCGAAAAPPQVPAVRAAPR